VVVLHRQQVKEAMNEQLKEQLVKFLGAILTGIEKGADFAIEQAPLVVQEYVAWQRVTTTVWLILGIIGLAAALRVFFWRTLPGFQGLWDKDRNGYVPDAAYVPYIVQSIICAILAFVTPFMIGDNITPCLKAWFAPRILVIEWIKSLL
jgi:hypothetical protein